MTGNKNRKSVYFASGLLLLAIAAACCYFGYYAPAHEDAAYSAALVNATSALMDNSKRLLETTSLPMFSNLNEAPAVCADNAAKVTLSVGQFNEHLSNLEKIAGTSHPEYLYGLSRDAVITKARQGRAATAVKQSRQVLAEYTAVAAFLHGLGDIRKEFDDQTAPLLAAVDLNTYLYRTFELRNEADVIDALAGRVALVLAPLELAPIQAAIASLFRETAAGYRDLAYSLEIGSDAGVDIAAHRIEAAIENLDTNIQNQYSALMNQSSVMKDLGELPDKYVIE